MKLRYIAMALLIWACLAANAWLHLNLIPAHTGPTECETDQDCYNKFGLYGTEE